MKYNGSNGSYSKNYAGSVNEQYDHFGIIESFDLDLACLDGKVESTDMKDKFVEVNYSY